MQIILNKSVANLGRAGDVVKVKDGYARNYLLPQKMALAASKENMTLVSKIQEKQKAIEEKERVEKSALAKTLEEVVCELEVLVGEEGKLFGSVTASDIAEIFKNAGHPVDKRKIHIKQPIKAVGDHEAEIKLSVDVSAQIKVKVSGKQSS